MLLLNINQTSQKKRGVKMLKKLFKTFAIVLFLMGSFVGKVISSELTFFTIGTGGTAYT